MKHQPDKYLQMDDQRLRRIASVHSVDKMPGEAPMVINFWCWDYRHENYIFLCTSTYYTLPVNYKEITEEEFVLEML